jgi:hypothetical protein
MGTGLDKHYPFNNSPSADWLVQNAESILASGNGQLGWRYALMVWGLVSNFILLDRLYATLAAGTAQTAAPSRPIPRAHCENLSDTFGTAVERVSISVLILTILSHLNVSSSLTSSHPRKYLVNSVWLGLLVKRLTSYSNQQPTSLIRMAILPKLR